MVIVRLVRRPQLLKLIAVTSSGERERRRESGRVRKLNGGRTWGGREGGQGRVWWGREGGD